MVTAQEPSFASANIVTSPVHRQETAQLLHMHGDQNENVEDHEHIPNQLPGDL